MTNEKHETFGFLKRCLLWIAGADLETLNLSPAIERGEVCAVAAIMCFAFGYQATLFALIGQMLFAGGAFRFTVFIGAIFLAGFILVLDSYIIMRAGSHASGANEIRRHGGYLPEGKYDRLKSGLFLTLRIGLSISLAQLTAMLAALLIFGADISASTQKTYLEANARLIASAAAQADAQIQRATNSVAVQNTRVSALSSQATRLTQNSLDPTLNDPAVQQAQGEIAQLAEQKQKAEEAVRTVEAFAANESNGVKGTPGNSGRPGQGSRYKQAMQQAADARVRVQELERKLGTAQTRLAEARDRAAGSSEAVMQRSREQLPALEMSLKNETLELERLKAELAKAIATREATIRKAVEGAPQYVGLEKGILAQITVLGRLAESDSKIAAVIVLIDLISFALEAAALLSKTLVRIPSAYAARVALDAHLRIEAIADEIKLGMGPDEDVEDDAPEPPSNEPEEQVPASGRLDASMNGMLHDLAPPMKRPRGRPRKHSRPPEQLDSAA